MHSRSTHTPLLTERGRHPRAARTHRLAPSPPPAPQHLSPGMPWEAEAARADAAATRLKGKCFLNEIKEACSPALGGALKTRPRATEIKVTFVPESQAAAWRGALGRVGPSGGGRRASRLPTSEQPAEGRAASLTPHSKVVSRSIQRASPELACAQSKAPLEVGTVTTQVDRWGNRGQRGQSPACGHTRGQRWC